MASIVRNLIKFTGLADELPKKPLCFKQFNIGKTLRIPYTKPEVKQIIEVMTGIYIVNTKVIKTPTIKSVEGQNLTGFKLIVEGNLGCQIQYEADEPTQSVHEVYFNVPFSSFIVFPSKFDIGDCVEVEGCVEDIYAKKIEQRSIYMNTIVLLDAKINK
ncbi:DUF3794 domain-containing protein [Clostridium aestuarii]|uniref:DUF3794 domain-containing protein n=1 Tax=Clostridium aestuarii TaxID=338193 RepID=A0ABT4CW29_9CLOT|nr:DUF3794 domain-containing protein [Clostridium aestuarii]MCY6483166.1 DUF3794 domain-containing protein [Clostridium aestuarii]